MKAFGNIAKDGQVRAIASDAITDGKPVVVNSDGTVSVISGSSASESLGTQSRFSNDDIQEPQVVYDSNSDRVVVAYTNNTSQRQGRCKVGAISGTDISYGSEVSFTTASTDYIGITFDSNSNRIVIVFRDKSNSNYGTAIVGTVDSSDNSISFGTEVVFNSSSTIAMENGVTFDSTNQKIVIGFVDLGNSSYAKAIVGTVDSSDNSISFGSITNFKNATTRSVAASYSSGQGKVLFCYKVGNTGKGIVGTVSGTGISFGDEAQFLGSEANLIDLAYSSSLDKHILVYHDTNDGGDGNVRTATISGTDVTFGTAVDFETGSTVLNSVTYDETANKFVTFTVDDQNSARPTYNSGTVSGTDVSVGTPVVVDSTSQANFPSVISTKDGKSVLVYKDGSTDGDSNVLQLAFESTNLTSENFIGFSDGAFADGESAVVNTTSTIDRNQSSLTAGQTYFVQTNGTLGTTADDPSVTAGTAISATEIIVKG